MEDYEFHISYTNGVGWPYGFKGVSENDRAGKIAICEDVKKEIDNIIDFNKHLIEIPK